MPVADAARRTAERVRVPVGNGDGPSPGLVPLSALSAIAEPGGAMDAAAALLIAPPGSYRLRAYLDAASKLGLRLLVVSEGEHSLAMAGGGLRVEFQHQDEALAAVRRAEDAELNGFGAVLATDDATVEFAGWVAQALGLMGNPPDAARLARRKDLARARLAAAGVRVPRFEVLDVRDFHAASLPPSVPFPCVVKPVAMSASRGVIRADHAQEFEAALERVRAIVADALDPEERSLVLVESFIPGAEVALEGLLRDGELEVLALFDKPDPLDGPYFEESIYVTPSRLGARAQEAIVACVRDAVAAYGLRTGPVHAELRWDGNAAWLLEVAARTIGGECSKLLRFDDGAGLEEVVLAAALGQDATPGGSRLAPGASGVMMLPTPAAGTLRRVEGVLAAREVPGIEEVSIVAGVGTELTPLPEGSAYLGYLFARGRDPEEVERALREAWSRLRIVIAPRWRLHPAAA